MKQLPFHAEVSVSQRIYNSQKWKKLRNAYIAEHALCEECLKHGKITPAEECHHKVEFLKGTTQTEIEALAYDWENLMSLCKSCHLEKHGKKKKINIKPDK